MKDHYSASCIGQAKARKLLSHYYTTFKRTSIHRNILFLAPRGQGKSMLCAAIAEKLKKPAYEIHAETIESIDYFFDCILLRYAINKDVTLILDEIHTLKKSVAEFLLPILANNVNHRNTIRYGGSTFDIDFRQFTFLAATTESQKVLTPLRNRLKEITLVDYTLPELAAIVERGATGIRLPSEVLNYLVQHVRSNARSAITLGQEAADYCGNVGKTTLDLTGAKELINILNVYQYGLTELEVQILHSIAKSRNASLTRLAAKSGFTASAQRDFERTLLAHDLIDVENGRRITDEGMNYLSKNLTK